MGSRSSAFCPTFFRSGLRPKMMFDVLAAINGLSQQVLAEKLSVSQPLVSFWELGKAKPDTKQAENRNRPC
jgi:Helix-turn-helix